MPLEGVDEELDETVAIARDLIRINTTNFGGGKSLGEEAAAEYVEAILARSGIEGQLVNSEPGRTSVVARIPGRNHAKPALVVHGHLDVVPADTDAWSVDPFEGVISDGCLWGRGAVDMKNMNAMILGALADVLSEGGPERDLIVAFFADEEDGGTLGSEFLVKEHPHLFDGATEAISEVGGYSIDVGDKRAYLFQTAEKAMLWLRLRARGRAGHASQIHDDNAVTALAEAVAKVGRQRWPIRLTQTTRQLINEIAAILGVDPQNHEPEELVLRTSASRFILATLRTTANPTLLDAGYKHNVVPGTAEALVDVRTFPGEEDAVLEQIRDIVGPDIDVQVVTHGVGLEHSFGGELVQAAVDSLARHDPGVPVLPYMLSGGTDNKALSRLGIVGYGFAPLRLPQGFDFPAMFHGVDERVPLDSLVFGRRVLADLLASY